MAAATLDHFPPDTKVEVWTKTGDSFDGGGRGSRVEKEVQVGTDGSLVLTGLSDEKEYWACGDTGQVVSFIAADPEPKKRRGRAAQGSTGDSARAASTPGEDTDKRPSGGATPVSATQQGGGGRSITSDVGEDATQEPPAKKRSSGKKKPAAKKAAAKKSSGSKGTQGRKGRKGISGARGTRS